MTVYHDAGQDEYYAEVRVVGRDEKGDTIHEAFHDKTVVEVEGDSGRTSPQNKSVESHEEAEDVIFEEAEKLMEKHP